VLFGLLFRQVGKKCFQFLVTHAGGLFSTAKVVKCRSSSV